MGSAFLCLENTALWSRTCLFYLTLDNVHALFLGQCGGICALGNLVVAALICYISSVTAIHNLNFRIAGECLENLLGFRVALVKNQADCLIK